MTKKSNGDAERLAWETDFLTEILPTVFDGQYTAQEDIPIVRDALLERFEENETGSYAREVMIAKLGLGIGSWLRQVSSRSRTGAIRYVGNDGKMHRYDNQASRAVPQTRKSGERVHQHKLWFEMTPQEFRLAYQMVVALATAHSAIAAAFSKVDAAIRRFPKARTAGEACRKAGIDPDEIQIVVDDLRRMLG